MIDVEKEKIELERRGSAQASRMRDAALKVRAANAPVHDVNLLADFLFEEARIELPLLDRGLARIELSRSRDDVPVSRDYRGSGLYVVIPFAGDEDFLRSLVRQADKDLRAAPSSVGTYNATIVLDYYENGELRLFHEADLVALSGSGEYPAFKASVVERTKAFLAAFDANVREFESLLDDMHRKLAILAGEEAAVAIERESRFETMKADFQDFTLSI